MTSWPLTPDGFHRCEGLAFDHLYQLVDKIYWGRTKLCPQEFSVTTTLIQSNHRGKCPTKSTVQSSATSLPPFLYCSKWLRKSPSVITFGMPWICTLWVRSKTVKVNKKRGKKKLLQFWLPAEHGNPGLVPKKCRYPDELLDDEVIRSKHGPIFSFTHHKLVEFNLRTHVTQPMLGIILGTIVIISLVLPPCSLLSTS